MNRLLAIILFVLATRLPAAEVYVPLVDFGLSSSIATNRTILVKGISLPRGVSSGVVMQDDRRIETGTDTHFWISNAVEGVYLIRVLAVPFRTGANLTEFRILVTNTTAVIGANSNLVASASNTYPPDTVAYGAAASDARYLLRSEAGTIGGGGVTNSQVLPGVPRLPDGAMTIAGASLPTLNFERVNHGTNELLSSEGFEMDLGGDNTTDFLFDTNGIRSLWGYSDVTFHHPNHFSPGVGRTNSIRSDGDIELDNGDDGNVEIKIHNGFVRLQNPQNAATGTGLADTNQVNVRPLHDRSLGLIDGTSALMAAATNTTKAMRFLWLGDSEGEMSFYTMRWMIQTQAIDGIAPASFKVGILDWYPSGQSGNYSRFDLSWQPGGIYYLSGTLTQTWQSSTVAGITADTLKYWYPITATNGTVNIDISVDGSTYTNVFTLDCSVGTRGLWSTNKALTRGTYKTARVRSTVYSENVWLELHDSQSTATKVSLFSAGGSTITDFLAQGTNSIRNMLTNLDPSVIFYQQLKPLSTQTNRWEDLRYLFTTYAPNASIVLPTFHAFDPTNEATIGTAESLLTCWENVVRTNGWVGIDNYSVNSWSNALALGMPSDSIHFYTFDSGYKWNGDRVARGIGLGDVINRHNYALLKRAALTNNWNGGNLFISNNIIANANGAPIFAGGITGVESSYSGFGFSLSSPAMFFDATTTYVEGSSLVDCNIGNNLAYGFRVTTSGMIIRSPTVPATAGATGAAGQIAWDSSFIYMCVAANTWKRVAIATW